MADLDAIASLGIRTLRYPLLWELVAPAPDLGAADWTWCDERVGRLRMLQIDPIVGLVHHGSGPRHTSLLDDGFASGLAGYAREVARRYPWITRYTPVNEPLTTARFSCLYGHWYPHRRDAPAFARALINQCRAVVLAMRAIREVNPRAQLVQTEDLGHVYSSPPLQHQARFENDRRWLTWDLLCGLVDRLHPLWNYLRDCDVRSSEVDWFKHNACPPDIIGINHYVTSDRFLDHRAERFPPHYRGGNGRDRYADVEAVRVLTVPDAGFSVIDEAWDRYHLPVALTEVHLGCSRDEQMRWLFQAWSAACAARSRGVDIRAVTPWSLLGSFDWDSLLTRSTGRYEPGAWDVRVDPPRRTALSDLMASLASNREPTAEWLALPGWWQRPDAAQSEVLSHSAAAIPALTFGRGANHIRATPRHGRASVSPLLITGASGTLGQAFGRICRLRGLPYRLLGRSELDIGKPASIDHAIKTIRPWGVINTAGYVRVDDAESNVEECHRENFRGATNLAIACSNGSLPMVTFSSDLVFDGSLRRPYVEGDVVNPLNVYGHSKAQAETSVLSAHTGALVIRTSAFFGPWDPHNFVTATLQTLARGGTVETIEDATVSPTYVPDLVNACLDLLIDGAVGLWHLTNQGAVSWWELATRAAAMADVHTWGLHPTKLATSGSAPRPRYSVLSSSRGALMPSLDDALERYTREKTPAASNAVSAGSYAKPSRRTLADAILLP